MTTGRINQVTTFTRKTEKPLLAETRYTERRPLREVGHPVHAFVTLSHDQQQNNIIAHIAEIRFCHIYGATTSLTL